MTRKNGWQLAEEAGESTPYAMQYLLGRAVWESDDLRDALRRYGSETLGDAEAILVIDETGFVKKAPSRLACNGSTVEPLGALRTVRSESF